LGLYKIMNEQQTINHLDTHDVFRSIFQKTISEYEERNHYVRWIRTQLDPSCIQSQNGRLSYEQNDYIIRLYIKDDVKMFTFYVGQKCLCQGTY
jgi:hypothetical protein